MKSVKEYRNIDEYIANFQDETKKRLEIMRKTISKAVPTEATEKISYGIPTFYLNGNLVHFAGYEHHIGFYPGSAPINEFASDLKDYKTSKGTVQFQHDRPLPLELITKITKVCVAQNKSRK